MPVPGLTFKPETDDMRDAPSLSIVARLVGDGAKIRAFDPEGMRQAKPMLPECVTYCRDAFDAAKGADALVLITEWNEFRALSPTRLRDSMRGRCWSICATSMTRSRCGKRDSTTIVSVDRTRVAR